MENTYSQHKLKKVASLGMTNRALMTKKTGTMNMPFNLHQFISTLALS